MRDSRLTLIISVAVALGVGVAAIGRYLTRGNTARSVAAAAREPAANATGTAGASAPSDGAETTTPDGDAEEIVLNELRYLPEQLGLTEGGESAVLESPEMASGERRIVQARALTDPERDGAFMMPRLSPDGLQVLATRPGQGGLYLLGLDGQPAAFLADANMTNARWTADGKIEVAQDGKVSVYGTDGVLEETFERQDPVYARDDAIYVRDESGAAPRALTANDDRYYAPQLSPDGNYVVYQGLYTGIYLAPADGSRPPVYIGQGNNPVWTSDSTGVVFDSTADDGHYVTEGDLYYVDVGATERTNLTDGIDDIAQMPSIGPDGTTIVYESDGSLQIGQLDEQL